MDEAWVRAEARVGQVLLGKWRLDRLLGVGGFAAVYAATHRAGKRVAIKVLHPEVGANASARARFFKEALAANTVDHPGTVSVDGDEVDADGTAFLVMELIEGESLENRRIRLGGKLDAAEVLGIADQVLDVLVAAHAHGILHRDLKPDNLFITLDGRVKVLDFGIARFRVTESDAHATSTGMLMGTAAFMPPEQALGHWKLVDARTDLWAVAATMFQLLTGQLVHGDDLTVTELLVKTATQRAPALANLVTDAHPALAHVVDRGLAFEQAERWQDARSMQDAVRRAYQEMTGDAHAETPRLQGPALARASTEVALQAAWGPPSAANRAGQGSAAGMSMTEPVRIDDLQRQLSARGEPPPVSLAPLVSATAGAAPVPTERAAWAPVSLAPLVSATAGAAPVPTERAAWARSGLPRPSEPTRVSSAAVAAASVVTAAPVSSEPASAPASMSNQVPARRPMTGAVLIALGVLGLGGAVLVVRAMTRAEPTPAAAPASAAPLSSIATAPTEAATAPPLPSTTASATPSASASAKPSASVGQKAPPPVPTPFAVPVIVPVFVPVQPPLPPRLAPTAPPSKTPSTTRN